MRFFYKPCIVFCIPYSTYCILASGIRYYVLHLMCHILCATCHKQHALTAVCAKGYADANMTVVPCSVVQLYVMYEVVVAAV